MRHEGPHEQGEGALNFEVLATDGAARRGRLRFARGVVETPVFMPVGTLATVKAMTAEELRAAGSEMILGNAFHLMLRPGDDLVARLGGLHGFTGWERPYLTDSGGYQVFSLAGLRRLTEEGVAFQSHLDGTPYLLTPERSMDVQGNLGADIAMAFDECPPWPAPREAVEEAAKRYKLIPLTRVDRASDLRPFMGAHAWQVDHVSGLSEEQEDEIAVLAELLRDYGDLWSDIGPTGQRDALKTIYESIGRLQAGGLCVGVGLDAMKLVSPGSPDPWTMDVLRVLVSAAAEPQMAVLREKNSPVRFAW